MYDLQKGYEVAKELYAQYGVGRRQSHGAVRQNADFDSLLAGGRRGRLRENRGALTGGIQTTGNYPGKATTPEQLMADFDEVLR